MQLMHHAKGNTDIITGEVHISDPRVYAVKRSDHDMPSFNEAVSGEFSEQYVSNEKSILRYSSTHLDNGTL